MVVQQHRSWCAGAPNELRSCPREEWDDFRVVAPARHLNVSILAVHLGVS